MKKTKIILWALAISAVAYGGQIVHAAIQKQNDIEKARQELAHRRMVWVFALEWCESRGIKEAINPADTDGTPSYYSYQFKPDTFRKYAERYSIIATTTPDAEVKSLMTDYDTATQIINRMIDDPKVNFKQEFPDCVKNKVGMPPFK